MPGGGEPGRIGRVSLAMGTLARLAATPPMLVVQVVGLLWSKATRHAAAANARAALPRAFGFELREGADLFLESVPAHEFSLVANLF